LIDGHLPLGGAGKGMDILTIVDNLEGMYYWRNACIKIVLKIIAIAEYHLVEHQIGFMSTFNYNMNQQTFIERAPKSGSRTLNTVDIQCISMSLCRHGPAVARVASTRINAYISEVCEHNR
jgi:hypothetical protein